MRTRAASLVLPVAVYLGLTTVVVVRYPSGTGSAVGDLAMLALPGLGGLLLTALLRTPLVVALSAATAVLPVAAVVRIVMDTQADPTSHNLWPIEVVMMFGVGAVVGGGGALLGAALRRPRGRTGSPT